ncbi:hypothetical protein ACFWA9_09985 [Kitasatospora sp. NPDC059973]|uniref:hypothetical protein n=1 Tax=Kitasatospora sp. NPDC059973 TaxID=3347020 RepID=UPI0036B30069
MANNDDERTPEEWREILRHGLRTPEENLDGNRRQRRRARAAHHHQARKDTAEWISDQRRREPIRPIGAALVVALILALGAGARWLWPDLNGTTHHPGAAPASTAPSAVSQASAPADTTSPTASPSGSPSPANLADHDQVVQSALRLYLTRDPMADRNHRASVERAAAYLEPALAANLVGNNDPGFDKLNSQSANARVTAVQVGPADPNLPVDNPLRVWRKAVVSLDVKGYTETTQTTTVQVEVTNDGAGEWRVSRILGL